MIAGFHKMRRTILCGIAVAGLVAGWWGGGGASSTYTAAEEGVALFSRADPLSGRVGTLSPGELFHVQAEVNGGSGRWCALGDSAGRFVGYVLCSKIVPGKEPHESGRRAKARPKAKGRTPGREKRVDEAPSGPVPTGIAVTPPPLTGGGLGVGSTTPPPGEGGAGRRWDPPVALLLLFVLLMAAGLLGAGYVFGRSKTSPQVQEGAEAETQGGAAADGPEIPGEVTADGLEVFPAPDGEPGASTGGELKYRMLDCVIVKADASSVGSPAKCQMCGAVQHLTAHMRCEKCKASMAYFVEVGPERQP